jgi:hypothetical protein
MVAVAQVADGAPSPKRRWATARFSPRTVSPSLVFSWLTPKANTTLFKHQPLKSLQSRDSIQSVKRKKEKGKRKKEKGKRRLAMAGRQVSAC